MKGKVIASVLLGLMFALAAMPAADANHPGIICNSTETATHTAWSAAPRR